MSLTACNLSLDDEASHYHPGRAAIVESADKNVGLIPGEHVVERLWPTTIPGEIVVTQPRTAAA